MDELVVDPLTELEAGHLGRFHESRPEWKLVVVAKRWTDEGWGFDKHEYGHANPYMTGMKYVLDRVLPVKPERVLDIGSPLVQSIALACSGVKVTVVDVRWHPDGANLGLEWVVGNCTSLPYPDKSFPVVTSCWVVAHVGDGRYGDAFDIDGDMRFLAEVSRVCSGFCVIGIGMIQPEPVNLFNVHRIYSWAWLEAAFDKVGLEIVDRAELPSREDLYVDVSFEGCGALVRQDGVYGIVTARPKHGS